MSPLEIILKLVLVTTLASCAQIKPAKNLWFHESIDAKAEAILKALPEVQGFAVAVYTPNGIYHRGFGVTDIETKLPVNIHTAFYIASSTKPLTALAYALMENRGEINLKNNLREFCPSASIPDDVHPELVTLENLLAQSSGIQNHPIQYRLAFTGAYTDEILWSLLEGTEPNKKFPLGTFAYSNYNYNIFTLLAEKQFHRSWKDTVQTEIFDKARMKHSSAYRSKLEKANVSIATQHVKLDLSGVKKALPSQTKTDANMQSAGGIFMSIEDASTWLELMVEKGKLGNKQIFPQSVFDRVTTGYTKVGAERGVYKRNEYGLGWHIGEYEQDKFIHHFGGYAGAGAHVSFMPEKKIGVAIFVNDADLGARMSDHLANYIYDTYNSRENAESKFDEQLKSIVELGNRFEEIYSKHRDKITSRNYNLSLNISNYAGDYFNRFGEEITIRKMENGYVMTAMNLTSSIQPFIEKDSLRIELIPGFGEVVFFAIDESEVKSLEFNKEVYYKAD